MVSKSVQHGFNIGKIAESNMYRQHAEFLAMGETKQGTAPLPAKKSDDRLQETIVVPRFTMLNAVELDAYDFPPSKPIIEPILKERELMMIHATRGLGKTLFSLQMAIHIAAGKDFLKWKVPMSHRVLYIDGEMQGSAIQQRFRKSLSWAGVDASTIKDTFSMVTPDVNDRMYNLSMQEGQQAILSDLNRFDVLFIDSYLTLANHGRVNDAESFEPMQDLLLKLRKEGKSVVFLHHDSKNGSQLGSIHKETILETVIALSPLPDQEDVEMAGTSFRLTFEKNRNFYGEDAVGLKVDIRQDVGFLYSALEDYQDQKIQELVSAGMKQEQIAEALVIAQSTVSRRCKALRISTKTRSK
ncbi:MAG: AAA family ATPase [Desulfovibrionaceae bacterium]|nr:AAA family ATPase [Desulfovibrionaceae bacterium]